jgi:hypothetical protein
MRKHRSARENQEKTRDRDRDSDQDRVDADLICLTAILEPEFSLLDAFGFPDFRSEVEYTSRPESSAEVHRGLKKARCAERGREEEEQSPRSGNA